MNKFRVRFMYNTDNRWEKVVECSSSISAMVIASEELYVAHGILDWCDGDSNLRIVIDQVNDD